MKKLEIHGTGSPYDPNFKPKIPTNYFLVNGAATPLPHWVDALISNVLRARYAKTELKAHEWLFNIADQQIPLSNGGRLIVTLENAPLLLYIVKRKYPHLAIGLE